MDQLKDRPSEQVLLQDVRHRLMDYLEVAASFNLETVVGQVQVCIFPRLWQGVTTTQPPR